MRGVTTDWNELSCGELLRVLLFPVAGDRPEVGQQFVDLGIGPAIDAREDVGDIAARVDAGGVGGGDQRQDVGETVGAGLRACEGPGFAPRKRA